MKTNKIVQGAVRNTQHWAVWDAVDGDGVIDSALDGVVSRIVLLAVSRAVHRAVYDAVDEALIDDPDHPNLTRYVQKAEA